MNTHAEPNPVGHEPSPQRAGILRYQATLVGVLLGLVALSVGHGAPNWTAVIGLAAVAALAERSRVRLATATELSISILPTVFAAAMFGPLAAMVVAIASFIGDFPIAATSAARTDLLLKWGIYTCTRAICGAAAGFAALAVSSESNDRISGLIMTTAAAALVAEPLDVAFGCATLKLRGGAVLPFLRLLLPLLVLSVSLYAPVLAALTVAYAKASPWTLVLFFAPALGAQRLFGLYQEQRQLASELAVVNQTLEDANLSFAAALVTTLDARDKYTAGHSAAVAIYARDIATRLGLSEEDIRAAHIAGLVHDIGKIGLPAGLLEKPGALNADEKSEMQKHPAIGERILNRVESYADIAIIVRHHHERVDGGGYPDALTQDSIPLLSRIIAVADAYNAMTSDRPYRDAMPSRVARLRLSQSIGTQFDGDVVSAFEAVLTQASEEYRTASRREFAFDLQQSLTETAGGSELQLLLV